MLCLSVYSSYSTVTVQSRPARLAVTVTTVHQGILSERGMQNRRQPARYLVTSSEEDDDAEEDEDALQGNGSEDINDNDSMGGRESAQGRARHKVRLPNLSCG